VDVWVRGNQFVLLTVTPPPRPIDGFTVQVTAAVSAYVSSLAMDPAIAAQVVRLGFMRDAASCSGSPDGFAPLSIAQGSFVPLSVGSTSGLYMRGAVIGNLLILGGAVIVVTVIATVLGCWVMNDGTEGRFRAALQRLRCPSVFYSGVLVLMSGVVTNCTSLAFLPNDGATAGNVLVVLLGYGLSLGYCVWVTVTLINRFPCRLQLISAAHMKRRNGTFGETTVGAWFMYFNEPTVRWVPRTPAFAGWKRHNSMYFNDSRFAWYSLLELWSTFVLAVLNGVNVPATSFCVFQLSVILAVSVVQCAVGVIMRPATTRLAGACQNALNVLSAFTASLVIAGLWTQNDDTIRIGTYIQLFALFLGLLKIAFDVVCVAIRVVLWTYRRYFAEKERRGDEQVANLAGAQAASSYDRGSDDDALVLQDDVSGDAAASPVNVSEHAVRREDNGDATAEALVQASDPVEVKRRRRSGGSVTLTRQLLQETERTHSSDLFGRRALGRLDILRHHAIGGKRWDNEWTLNCTLNFALLVWGV